MQIHNLLLFCCSANSLEEFWNRLWVSLKDKIIEMPSILFCSCSENGSELVQPSTQTTKSMPSQQYSDKTSKVSKQKA